MTRPGRGVLAARTLCPSGTGPMLRNRKSGETCDKPAPKCNQVSEAIDPPGQRTRKEESVSVPAPHLSDLSAEHRRRLESLLLNFDESWHEGRLKSVLRNCRPTTRFAGLPSSR